MSQRDSAPRPISRHSSRSPARATAATSSPPIHRSRTQQDVPRSQPFRDAGGFQLIHGDGAGHQAESRIPDTRDINPTGPHGGLLQQSPAFRQPSATGGNPQPAMGAGQYGGEGSPSRPFAYQGPGATTPRLANQSIPTTTSPAGPHTSADRGSPHAVHPYPMAARRILTPKSPRATSLSRAAMRTVEAQHLTSSFPGPGPRGAGSAHDTQTHGRGPSSLGTPPQFRNSIPGSGPAAHSPTRPLSSLARSLSQPSLGHGFPSGQTLEPPQPGSLKREHNGRPVLSGPPFAAPLPAGQSFNTSETMGGDPRWGPGLLSSMSGGATRSLSMSEGQPMMTITPRHGEEIVVAVDVHQGSRVADQKRQRNAGASARFRQRKKEREKEQQEELQKLENENRDLERKTEELAKRYQELEAQRDHYRTDRNRLRDVLSQMPGGKEWADRGPPSPVLRAPGVHFTSDNSAALHHQQPPPPSPAYSQPQHHPPQFHQSFVQPLAQQHSRPGSYGDSSGLEPPARRRRTDSEPQLPTSSYILMTPTSLPPITGPIHPPPPPTFGMPPSPHVTPPPPPGNARLPPLRFDQSRTPSTTPPPIQTAPPPPSMPLPSASPYVTTRRLPYETGWATDPRPDEGGHR